MTLIVLHTHVLLCNRADRHDTHGRQSPSSRRTWSLNVEWIHDDESCLVVAIETLWDVFSSKHRNCCLHIVGNDIISGARRQSHTNSQHATRHLNSQRRIKCAKRDNSIDTASNHTNRINSMLLGSLVPYSQLVDKLTGALSVKPAPASLSFMLPLLHLGVLLPPPLSP